MTPLPRSVVSPDPCFCEVFVLYASPVAKYTPIDFESEIDRIVCSARESERLQTGQVQVSVGVASSASLTKLLTLSHGRDPGSPALILHLAAHGYQVGGLILESAKGTGEAHECTHEKLRSLLHCESGENGGGLRGVSLLMLSSCSSIQLAQVFIDSGCQHVIATDRPVLDKTAKAFTERFYRALFVGKSIVDAFEHAKAALLASSHPEVAEQSHAYHLLKANEGDVPPSAARSESWTIPERWLYMLMRPSPPELHVEWTIDWANDLREKIRCNRLGSYSILTSQGIRLREENMGELDPIPCENDFPLRIRFEANQSDRVTSNAQRDFSRPMVSQSHPRNTVRKGKGKGKMTWASSSGMANLEHEEQMEVNRLAANLGQALLAGNWFEVNRLMKSPEEVWMLACSECGSRQLQELLRTSSHSEQAALKSQAVDKVILGLQSHVLEATVGSRGCFANYLLQAVIQALPVERFTFVLEEMRSQVVNVALDPQGCRVLQRLLEHILHLEDHARMLMEELMPAIKRLAMDQFGNHVMQKFQEMASDHQKLELTKAFLALARQPGELRELAMDKYSSWVLEKVISESRSSREKKQLLSALERELEGTAMNGKKAKKSEYGSFVHRTVRKMTDRMDQGGVSDGPNQRSEAPRCAPAVHSQAMGQVNPQMAYPCPPVLIPFNIVLPPDGGSSPYMMHHPFTWQRWWNQQ